MKTNRTKRRHLSPPANPKKVFFFAVVPNMLSYVHVLYNKKGGETVTKWGLAYYEVKHGRCVFRFVDI